MLSIIVFTNIAALKQSELRLTDTLIATVSAMSVTMRRATLYRRP